MKRLMHRIMLSCDDATRLISLKRYKQLTLIERIQLSLHLMACKYCSRFAKFNELIDDSIEQTCLNLDIADKMLSDDRKDVLKKIITEKENKLQ